MSYTITVLTEDDCNDEGDVRVIHSHHGTGRVTVRELSEFGDEYAALLDAMDAILALDPEDGER